MSKLDCHGCDGKGWVMITVSERITPFLSGVDRQPIAGFGVLNRECQAASCPIRHGSGVYPGQQRAAD